MRRRRPLEATGPRPLVEYRAQDWPGVCHPECAYWQAVADWQAEHPEADLDLRCPPDPPWHPELI